MVTENLKNVIIRRIYKDVEAVSGRRGAGKEASPACKQYFAASGPVIAALSSGMAAGFSAILLPQLMKVDTDIVITKQEGSWIASMLAVPLALGCIVSGYLMDTFGRKLGQVLSCIPFTIGWVVLATATNVPALYVGRFMTGFCVGLISPMCQVYIAETSEPKHRGILLSGAPLAVAMGIFIAHTLGTFLSWRVTAAICGLPPLICILIIVFVQETPSWLISQGKIEEAEISYRWYRGTSEEATKELHEILKKQTVATVETSKTETVAPSKLKLMCQPAFIKPFVVLNVFFFVQQFSGVNAVAFYSIDILKNVLSSFDEYIATIVIDTVRFIVSLFAIFLLKTHGRKYLSIVSAIGTAISLFVMSIYLGFFSANFVTDAPTIVNGTSIEIEKAFEAVDVFKYLPLVCLISYISFVSIGLVPIPWVLTGELFSKEMRGIGSGVTSSFGFLCYFLVVKTTPDLFEYIGTAGTFAIFGIVSISGSLILWLFLVETKDKTLSEIEAFYKKKQPVQPEVPEFISVRL